MRSRPFLRNEKSEDMPAKEKRFEDRGRNMSFFLVCASVAKPVV